MTVKTRGTRGRGSTAARALVVACATGAAILTALPASAAEPHIVQTPSFLAYTDSFTPDTTVFYPSGGWVPVGTSADEQGNVHTSRVYLGFDIGGVNRARLSSAKVVAREGEAADCAKPRWVKAQQTEPFTENNTWAHPPVAIGGEIAPVAENAGCLSYRVTWEMVNAVDRALRRGGTKLWVELQVAGDREVKKAFARWLETNEFKLEISLTNTAPNKPTRIGVNYDTPCSADFFAGQDFTGFAGLTDPDRNPGDLLTPQFEYWPVADPSHVVEVPSYVSSGGDGLTGVATMPVHTLADGAYAWHARAYDQRAYGAWSDPCPFMVDRTAPAVTPTVASPEFPENPPHPTGERGQGTFLFTANGVADVKSFRYGDAPYSMYQSVPADQLGGAATIRLDVRDTGVQTLYVVSVDRAGNSSPVRAYTYNVRDLTLNAYRESQTVAADGSGISANVRFTTQADNGIVTIGYTVNGGTQQTVAASANGSTLVAMPALRGGTYTLHYTGFDASGSVLWESETTFNVDDSPTITSDGVYPIDGSGGGAGVTGVFTVTPLLNGAQSVEYFTTQNSDHLQVPVGADGSAHVNWTPTQAGWTYFWFRVHYADGSTSWWKSFSTTVNS